MFLGSRGGPHPGSSGVMGCPWALYRPSKGSRKKVHRPPAAGGSSPSEGKGEKIQWRRVGGGGGQEQEGRGGDYKE